MKAACAGSCTAGSEVAVCQGRVDLSCPFTNRGVMPGYRSVLVVDDDADVRESMSDALSLEGHPNVVAADGPEALAALERCESPVLVLLDSVMPRMDGAVFLEKLSRLESRKDVHVVLTSARGGPRLESPLVIGELPKPFDLAALQALLAAGPRVG